MINLKQQRQTHEYNRQLGQNKINEKIKDSLQKINTINFKIINNDVKSFIRKHKQTYQIKNCCKLERTFIQTINKFSKIK
jgi:hypothetical protein